MAREGWPFLIPPGIAAFLCGVLIWQTDWGPAAPLAIGFALLAGFIAFFFRDPERIPPEGENLVVAGGDGWVVSVEPEDDPWLGQGGTRVSVFLSIFDVHVNRIPAAGTVERVDYRPGRFGLAWRPKTSQQNEHTVICIKTPESKMVVKQIAGFVARRIICRLNGGDKVGIGDRFGLIRFGSRVDHILPASATVEVTTGTRVRAGVTVIGVLNG